MKQNRWTIALLGAGLIAVPSLANADETPSSVLTAVSSTTLSGYVDTSAHWNPGTGNQNLPGYTPNSAPGGKKADGFNLDVIELTLNKPVGDGEWGAGYNVTMAVGPDAVGYNNSFGSAASDLSLKDTYVELKAPIGNGLDLKLGTFTEILGYEVFETPNNPNYTRSYGYFTEPTALTGALATYQISPVITVQGGIANTWSAGLNSRAFAPVVPAGVSPKAESFKTYMGSIALTAPESMGFLAGSTLFGGIISGYDAFSPGGVLKTSSYVGGTVKTPIKNLTVGFAEDYVALGQNALDGTSHGSGYQFASAVYLALAATEKLTFNTRADYFTQSTYLPAAEAAIAPGTGMASRAFALTETVQYNLWKNVVTRLEFRWDHALDASSPFSTGLDNVFLVAANIVYKF